MPHYAQAYTPRQSNKCQASSRRIMRSKSQTIARLAEGNKH